MGILNDSVKNKLSERSLIRRLDDNKSRSVIEDIERVMSSKIEKRIAVEQVKIKAELAES